MRIVWLTWKDTSHPLAGGAETVSASIMRRMAADGHELIVLTAGYPGAPPRHSPDGYSVVRVGGRFSVYLRAWQYYRKHLKGWADMTIDEVNTMPFFARYYANGAQMTLFYMLCRKVWLYQMIPPLSLFGYGAEKLYVRLLRGVPAVTISDSSRRDMVRYGLRESDISLMRIGTELKPLGKLPLASDVKVPNPTLLSLGSIRPMKRTLHQLKAFEYAKRTLPELRMIIAGSPEGSYGARFMRRVGQSPYKDDIVVLGRVGTRERLELMRSCHLILVTSVKEGWGLIVTEAASQGTPAAVYDVDGLRDSVHGGDTGVIAAHNTPKALADAVVKILTDDRRYEACRRRAWQLSRRYTFDAAYQDFMAVVRRATETA